MIIVIIDGCIKVGLNLNEFILLGKFFNVFKVFKCDIFYCVIKKYSGVIIVLVIIFIVDMVGIKVFVIGGIGGVYKDVVVIFDILRDFEEIFEK